MGCRVQGGAEDGEGGGCLRSRVCARGRGGRGRGEADGGYYDVRDLVGGVEVGDGGVEGGGGGYFGGGEEPGSRGAGQCGSFWRMMGGEEDCSLGFELVWEDEVGVLD